MTKKRQVWKCEICGNIVEVLHEGKDSLVCCGKPMELQEENYSENEGNEKHVPVIEKVEGGIRVKVGEKEHPMEEKHYIEWIEVSTDKGSSKKFLKPGQKPEAFFPIKTDPENVKSREYCNVHGLWKSERVNKNEE